jgi:hypothetical protein
MFRLMHDGVSQKILGRQRQRPSIWEYRVHIKGGGMDGTRFDEANFARPKAMMSIFRL